MRRHSKFSDRELQAIKRQRAAGRTFQEISDMLGGQHDPSELERAHLENLAMRRARRKQYIQQNFNTNGGLNARGHVRSRNVTDAIFEERAARQAAGHESLTAAICGDPPKGYSALDWSKRWRPYQNITVVEVA